MLGSANFCDVTFVFAVTTCSFSDLAFTVGFRFSALQKLRFYSFGLSFGLVPYFAVYVVLCIGSSLVSFSRFDISAFGILFFL